MVSPISLHDPFALGLMFILGLLCGVLIGYIWADHKDLARRATKGVSMSRIIRPSTIVLLLIFAGLQVLTGVFMIVQYARLTNFIDCQAAYNESTSDSRDAQLPARNADSEALFRVLEAYRSGDQALINQEMQEALTVHDHSIKVQRENPYKPPSDFCENSSSVNGG